MWRFRGSPDDIRSTEAMYLNKLSNNINRDQMEQMKLVLDHKKYIDKTKEEFTLENIKVNLEKLKGKVKVFFFNNTHNKG